MILNQLKNNIIAEFDPPEYKIARRFHVDGYSEKEMINLLNSLDGLSQIIKVKIQNAYRDITILPDLYNEYGVWDNEQLYKLKMKKLRNER